jgi:adenylate kinase family enzyme
VIHYFDPYLYVKGTQCSKLLDEFGPSVVHLNIGFLLRTELEKQKQAKRNTGGAASVSTGHSPSKSNSPNSSNRTNSSLSYGEMLEESLSQGKIVPGFVTAGLIKNEISRRIANAAEAQTSITVPTTQTSFNCMFLIDGFPRTMDNVQAFEQFVGSAKTLISISCPNDLLTERLNARGKHFE